MFNAIKSIVEESNTVAGRAFDLFIQALIVISLISFSIDTIPDLPDNFSKILDYVEIVTVIIFTIEYLLRLLFADYRLKFVFSFFGLVDLIAILPFYIAAGVDLRSVRVLRLFRLIRILKIVRYNNALLRIKDAFIDIKEELLLFITATCMLLFIASVGIYYFENSAQPEQFKSIFHSLWWAIVTLTTIGYGDVYPITIGGKIFTSVIALIGIGVVAVPTGLFSSAMTKVIDKHNDMDNMEK